MIDYLNVDKECPVPEPLSANLGSLIFLGGLFFLTFIGRFIFAPLMPYIERDLGISHSQAGSLFLVISAGLFMAQILSGFLSSRVNHKGSLFFSTLGIGMALLIVYFVKNLWAISGALFFLGMAAGLHMPSAIPTITAMVERRDWGKALGIHGTAPPLSLVIAPFLVIMFLNCCSWRAVVILIGIVAISVSFIFRRVSECGGFPGEPPRPRIIKMVLEQRSYWIMVIIFAFFIGGSVGIYTMLPLYLIHEKGFHGDFANSLIGLSRISGLFITFLSGLLMDRIGEKRHMMIILFISGIFTVLIGVASRGLLGVMIFIQPAVIGCFPTAGFSALARIVQPNLRSVAASLTTPIAFFLGGGIIPTLLGYMGQTYSFGLGIIILGCLVFFVAFLVIPLQLIDDLEEGC